MRVQTFKISGIDFTPNRIRNKPVATLRMRFSSSSMTTEKGCSRPLIEATSEPMEGFIIGTEIFMKISQEVPIPSDSKIHPNK